LTWGVEALEDRGRRIWEFRRCVFGQWMGYIHMVLGTGDCGRMFGYLDYGPRALVEVLH